MEKNSNYLMRFSQFVFQNKAITYQSTEKQEKLLQLHRFTLLNYKNPIFLTKYPNSEYNVTETGFILV